MEGLDQELFLDDGSMWNSGDESMSSCDLSDDWSMESYLQPQQATSGSDDVVAASEESSSEWTGEDSDSLGDDDSELSGEWSVEVLENLEDNKLLLHPQVQARRLEIEAEAESRWTLHDMIKAMWRHSSKPRWEQMEELLERNPHSARVVTDGLLPLHFALCRHEPELSTIRALVAAYPQALSAKSTEEGDEGCLPLHLAAGRCDTPLSVLRTVLYANEEAAMNAENDCGHLPIHRACHSWGNVSSVWELLSFYPEGASKTDHNGMKPLDCLVLSSRNVSLQDIPKSMMHEPKVNQHRYCCWAKAMEASIDMDILFWADAQLLLMAEHHGKVPPIPPPDFFRDGCFITVDPFGIPGAVGRFRAVHAALGTGAPQALIELVMTMFPEQISELDEDHGRLPLHWACMSQPHKTFYCIPCSSMKSETTWYATLRDLAQDARIGFCEDCYTYGIRYAVTRGLDASEGTQFKQGEEVWDACRCASMPNYKKATCDVIMERVVAAFPAAAAISDKHKRLPLHYLVSSMERVPDPVSLAAVIDAFPSAIDKRDPVTGLRPIEAVILMADHSMDRESSAAATERVEIIYSILRRNPDYLKSAARGGGVASVSSM